MRRRRELDGGREEGEDGCKERSGEGGEKEGWDRHMNECKREVLLPFFIMENFHRLEVSG